NELDHDAVWISDLKEALAPRLGLDRRSDRNPLLLKTRILPVDVIDDKDDQESVGRMAMQGLGLEGLQPGPQEDQVEARVLARERDEAVGGHLQANDCRQGTSCCPPTGVDAKPMRARRRARSSRSAGLIARSSARWVAMHASSVRPTAASRSPRMACSSR